jgi:hypothetical protein
MGQSSGKPKEVLMEYNDGVLKKVHEKASAIYKDEKERAEFMEGFMKKVASLFNKEEALKGFASQLGRASAAGVVGAGLYGIASLVKEVKNHNKYNNFLKALNEAVQMNRVLKAADKDKVVKFAHTIYKFAPSVSTDPNMLSSILANAVHGDGIDPMTIRTLTELESRYTDTNSFNPKQWT